MSKETFRVSDPCEAEYLDRVQLRLVRPEEQERWDQLVSQHHYLKNAQLVGERLCYVAEQGDRWVGLLGWSAASYHLKGRESWIGWNPNQRQARLHLIANNARFCLLTQAGQCPNLGSHLMAQNLRRLSRDWQEAYGHPILAVESFVDLQLFRGTSYKATGWKALGSTAGFKRVSQDFYEVHERPKQLFVRELAKHASRRLRSRDLGSELRGYERKVHPRCLMPPEELSEVWSLLHQQVPEIRDAQGMRHKQATVLTITLAYLLAGGQGGHRGVALFARDLTRNQRAALKCWFNRRTRRYDVPTENCIYRVLKTVPVLPFQQALWAWQKSRLGAQEAGVVVLDGKALRGSQGTQLVGAVEAASGRALGIEAVASKSNEIPAAQTLLGRLDLEGTIALMDALHTQVQTARTIVQEGGGDYVMIAKGNQETLRDQAKNLLPEDFSPLNSFRSRRAMAGWSGGASKS